jgi:CRP/FNR family transcriptional regulator
VKPSDPSIDEAVRGGPLSRFPRERVDEWLKAAIRLEAPQGSFIYYEHDEPRAGLVVEGLLRLFMTAPDGRQVTVRYARPGQLIGIAAVIGGPAPVSAQMLTRATLLMFPIEALKEAGRSDPRIAWLFAEEVCRRLYDSLEGLAGNAFGSLKERVCRNLLEMATDTPGDRLVARTTQQELANAVGSTRVAVARILNELRREGLIESASGGVVLNEPMVIHEAAWARE